MNTNKPFHFITLIPALWASFFDILITIIHQDPEYWNGNLDKANEANPIGAYLMGEHISGIFIISGVWLILIPLIAYYLPRRLSRIFLLFVLMAHSYAVCTWLSPRYGFWSAIILMIFNVTLYILIDEKNDRLTIEQKKTSF